MLMAYLEMQMLSSSLFDLGTNAVKKTKALGKPGNRYPVEITR